MQVIEGVGRTKADGKLSLQALGLISFDDETGTYRMRAFNDGRWLETEVKLADGVNSISWGFALGEFKTTTVLRINENGEWTEHGELVIGGRPPQKMMELKVRRGSRPTTAPAEADGCCAQLLSAHNTEQRIQKVSNLRMLFDLLWSTQLILSRLETRDTNVSRSRYFR